jgi:hypothetical protein
MFSNAAAMVFCPYTFFHDLFFTQFFSYGTHPAETEFNSVAEFLVPDWRDIVDSCIGLSYRPARYRLAGRHDNHMPD